MKKVLFLDGALNTSETSYSTAVMNYVHGLFGDSKYSVKRVDLNQTVFAKTILNEANLNTYWNDVESDKWINELKETDLLVVSMSMINFAPSTVLKNFIDAVTIAGKTFTYEGATSTMPVGLLSKLKVLIIATQGANYGTYPWGDHVKWLKGTLNFLGVKNIYNFDIFGTKVSEISKLIPQEFVESEKDKINHLVSEIKENL